MRSIYANQLRIAADLPDARLQVLHTANVIRSLLQTCSFCLVEYWVVGEQDPEEFPESSVGEHLFHPSDGHYGIILDTFLPRVRSRLWQSCALRWYERLPGSDGKGVSAPLSSGCQEWVRFRNDKQGHGVLDLGSAEKAQPWLHALAEQLLDGLADLVPSQTDDGLVLTTPSGPLPLESLRILNGEAPVIRDIRKRNAGTGFRVRYQPLNADVSQDATYDLPPEARIGSLSSRRTSIYEQRALTLGNTTWRPSVRLPSRQTRIFEGRRDQLAQLLDWWEDLDSKACLVYGEGGIGKTTLALEFLNNMLEAPPPDLRWRPVVVCYYSAKKTRWTSSGLHYLRGVTPAVADAIRMLVELVENKLDAKWYSDDVIDTINRAANLLGTAGLKRNDVLLVLDNTETLARIASEESAIAAAISKLSSKVARVFMTSRRREAVEAFPVRLELMDEATSVRLLEQLAAEYDAAPLKMAGTKGVARIARKLHGRPLALDVFARYAALPGKSLDDALSLVLRDMGQDLGRFLFDDAWQRLPQAEQDTFLTLGTLGDAVDGRAVGRVCASLGIAHDDFLTALEETHFGALLSYGTTYDLVLSNEMREFLHEKEKERGDARRTHLANIGQKAVREVQALIKAEETTVIDRVQEAFQTSAAKAAYSAAKRGDFDEARLWFDEAVVADPQNASLWERYAWFLLIRLHDADAASKMIREALRLAPGDAETHFTAGLIAARRADIAETDREMETARKLGKPSHTCALQRARARGELLRRTTDPVEADRLRQAGERIMRDARDLAPGTPFRDKHLAECRRVDSLLGLRGWASVSARWVGDHD